MFGIVDPFRSFYQLSKPVLSALVVGSGTAGFLMAGSPIHFSALASVTVGTFLTAFSANTLNQCYEVRGDTGELALRVFVRACVRACVRASDD